MEDVLQELVLVQQELAASRVETTALRDRVDKLVRNLFDTSPASPQIQVTVPPPIPLASPDRYSGDPAKTQVFLTLILLHFSCKPASFPNNHSRVALAISYLVGDAANWGIPLVRNNDACCPIGQL